MRNGCAIVTLVQKTAVPDRKTESILVWSYGLVKLMRYYVM